MSEKLDEESLRLIAKVFVLIGAAWMLIMPALGYYGLSAGGLILFLAGVGIWLRVAETGWLRFTSLKIGGILIILISIPAFWITKSWLRLPEVWTWPWALLNGVGFIMMILGRILRK